MKNARNFIKMILQGKKELETVLKANEPYEYANYQLLLRKHTLMMFELVCAMEEHPELYKAVNDVFARYGHPLNLVKHNCDMFLYRLNDKNSRPEFHGKADPQ